MNMVLYAGLHARRAGTCAAPALRMIPRPYQSRSAPPGASPTVGVATVAVGAVNGLSAHTLRDGRLDLGIGAGVTEVADRQCAGV